MNQLCVLLEDCRCVVYGGVVVPAVGLGEEERFGVCRGFGGESDEVGQLRRSHRRAKPGCARDYGEGWYVNVDVSLSQMV